ncbi:MULTISPECIES: DNA-directed RNA polymerase subunit K [Acidianus]|uniref:DNA-directed RNA polymerase subunit Rpo6 n=1 Tax=Candidatus Acidianus copahuensis TaxID=1160895 RepID=A0A031LPF5_9CREN|nr:MULTISPECIES: DNA-directed RNA polymerase subunit K [Acidianus]EZQ06856.1 DNA-directed RNA polymerase subunit K [Candidatus Acidianus copahuensis]NON61919.1 DNA-directed RNA polymerase subunit K [Acidianus sp. RZ1]
MSELSDRPNGNYILSWRRRLTIYEKARIISARTLQLAMGAVPLIDMNSLSKDVTSMEIAEEELKRGILPITIRRRFPDGGYDIVSIKDISGE